MANDKPTLIFAVRHCETEWNRLGKQQGQLDSPLSEFGSQQAHALADGLQDKGITAIYSSDLGRAMQTARIIAAKLALKVTAEPRLRERHLGSMQGLTLNQFSQQFPDEWAKYNSADPDYVLPGGESARQRYERSVACVEQLAQRHAGQTILAVVHDSVLQGLFYRALGIPLSVACSFSLVKAAINSFSITGNAWCMETWGEIGHLQKLSAPEQS